MDIAAVDLRIESQGRRVLDIPSLLIRDGRVTAILGPNGAGKTTLLRAIAGLEKGAAGSIRLGDQAVEPGYRAGRRVAFAFQEAIFLRATMRRNLELALELRGIPRSQRAEKASDAASHLGVRHLLDRHPRQLSGGELQRFNVARAISLEAPIALFDEPMSGIDGRAREQLADELPETLRRFTRTAVIVTHDRLEAFRLAQDVVVLLDGRVRAAGPKGEVFRDPPDAQVAHLLGYTILERPGGTLAVPPDALRIGAATWTFEMRVTAVADLGSRFEARGTVEGTPVALTLPPDAPQPVPGDKLMIGADSALGLGPAASGKSFAVRE
ncbi:MAG: ABC transporter ATP-binding protein [Candidatus Sericytochromatia bacterium]|uniref:ABC transporter ATP-binding protein n=1 Tax=Candidatus Tanganyikabacteria bacterium TaxID=2961651 RepID=A0A938BLV6_9BACT|nr:ABC transporter ATP-binding protein [Candidatus Tanganyikabacteria bacterium]